MNTTIPNIDWYLAQSKHFGLPPRCSFASIYSCPRFYESRSQLGKAGSNSIPSETEAQLDAKWKNHPLSPQMPEDAPSISGNGEHTTAFDHFCPEVIGERFKLFASYLGAYTNEFDRGMAHQRLSKEGAPVNDPSWAWQTVTPQHYAECPLYSQLSHDWHKHLTHPGGLPPNAAVAGTARFDVFISHASEDKDFARPLAQKLEALGLRVWFDESAMKPGDSLREEIDKGLASSDFGVVILSKHFFKKQWTQAELNGLFTLKLEGKNRIVPVWHEITKTEIVSHSPMIADLVGIRAIDGAASVAVQILKVVRPVAVEVFSASLSPGFTPSGEAHGGKFQIELGKRHRHLREKILKINPRRMADFYGFEKVAQLETCERGDDEFPTAAIKKLREFFFIRQKYLEEGALDVFETFEITCSPDDCRKYISQDFEPILLCRNEDREKLWCYPVFHKAEDGFDRIIVANTFGYFASRGGGKTNIMHLIEALHEKGIEGYTVPIQKVDRKTWNALGTRTFYSVGMEHFLGPDPQAQDCFIQWFEEFERDHKPNQ